MTTALLKLRGLCASALNGVAGLPAARQWEGEPFEAETDKPYVRSTWLYGEVSTLTLHNADGLETIEETPILQIDVFWPKAKGTKNAETLAETIRARFKPGTRFNDAPTGLWAEVRKASRAPNLDAPNSPWMQAPVRIIMQVLRPND